jgi:predicted Zn-dependent protease
MFDEVQFHLVNSETLNAFTTGGTHVYLYSQLFETTKNEDEFAAVVSHEFAHIVARHVAKGTNRQYGVMGLAAAAAVGGYALGGDNKMETAAAAGGAGLVAGQFIGMGFTRGDESEADKFGFQFYANAGWNPDQFGGFFQTLIDKGLDSSSALTSDHPLLKDRVVNAKKWSADWKQKYPNWQQNLQAPIADASQFAKYQQRAIAVGKKTPNDKSLAAAKLMLNAFPSCVAPTDQPQQTKAREALGAKVEEPTKKKK